MYHTMYHPVVLRTYSTDSAVDYYYYGDGATGSGSLVGMSCLAGCRDLVHKSGSSFALRQLANWSSLEAWPFAPRKLVFGASSSPGGGPKICRMHLSNANTAVWQPSIAAFLGREACGSFICLLMVLMSQRSFLRTPSCA